MIENRPTVKLFKRGGRRYIYSALSIAMLAGMGSFTVLSDEPQNPETIEQPAGPTAESAAELYKHVKDL